MQDSASRRRVLQNMAAFGAAGTVSGAFASEGQHPRQFAQAQPGAQGRTSAGAEASGLPRIQLTIGPGTLPSVGKDRMDLLRYRVSGIPRLNGQQLLEPLPEIAKIARVEVDKGNPWEMATYEDLRKLSVRVGELLRSSEVDGLVWVQGTNTIEETAYFLSLTVQSEKPIVVTGAQRPYNGLSTDGPMNLLDAVRLACAPETRGKGAVVAFNGEINAALANALVGLGAKGIVIASVGAGSPGNLDKEIGEIIKNRSAVVVQSSRVGEGRIVRNNNWYEPGMVVADNLSPQKAAILLSLALIKTSTPEEIQRIFDEY